MNVLASKQEKVTFTFGNKILNGKPYNHTGLDIVRSPSNLDTIVAAQKGRVKAVVSNVTGRNLNKGYGNYVELEHGGGISTKYCHLKYGSIKVRVGQIVEKGQELGYMGDTGYTFGAHLHLEVKVNGVCVDPLPYIQDKKSIGVYGQSVTNSNFWVRVDKTCGANVRKQANTKSVLSGSRFLKKGDKFEAVEIVNGESVSGNNKWYKSKKGNYVWSGGLTRI